jgi:cytochrome P450
MDALKALATPEARKDPYPILQWLRTHEPVHRTSAGFYLVTRYEDVLRVLQGTGTEFLGPDARRLSSQYPGALVHRSQQLFLNSVAMKNPPEHTGLRRLIDGGLDASRTGPFRRGVERCCDELLDSIAGPLADGDGVDLHAAFSVPLARHTVSRVIGVPPSDGAWLSDLIAGIYPAIMPLTAARDAAYEQMIDTADEKSAVLESYLTDLMARRTADAPGTGLLAALASTRAGGAGAAGDSATVVSLVWVLWITVDTMAGGLDQVLLAALANPDRPRFLTGEADTALRFVDESIRLFGSSLFAGVVRIAAGDVELSGTAVPAGSDVRPSTAAANRDPAVFPDPDAFSIARDNARMLGYGAGMRQCPGTDLARDVMALAAGRLFGRFAGLVNAGEETLQEFVATRLVSRLPVALGERG